MTFVELLEQPSIEQHAVIATALVSESSWLDPYIAFCLMDLCLLI